MNAHETTGIRELTAEEMEGVTGGLTMLPLWPLMSSMYLALAEAAGTLCDQDPFGNGTTIGDCATW
jgi:hypothetical protein